MLGDNFASLQLETYSGNLTVETDRGTFGLSPNAWPDIDPCFVKQSGTINLMEWTPELKPGPASGAQTQDPLLATSTGNVVCGPN